MALFDKANPVNLNRKIQPIENNQRNSLHIEPTQTHKYLEKKSFIKYSKYYCNKHKDKSIKKRRMAVSKWNEKKAAGAKLKSDIMPKLLRIEKHKKCRVICSRLYKIIADRMQQFSNESDNNNHINCKYDSLNAMYDKIMSYKQFDELNPCKLKYVLQKHIFPKMDEKSDTILQKGIIINYVHQNLLLLKICQKSLNINCIYK